MSEETGTITVTISECIKNMYWRNRNVVIWYKDIMIDSIEKAGEHYQLYDRGYQRAGKIAAWDVLEVQFLPEGLEERRRLAKSIFEDIDNDELQVEALEELERIRRLNLFDEYFRNSYDGHK